MNLILDRKLFREDGIFGEMTDENGGNFFFTLERSYLVQDEVHPDSKQYYPKVPQGTYECKLGKHRLNDGIEFDTFEVENVEGHTGILFHVGNYNTDSEGCILIGLGQGRMRDGGMMLTSSKQAFKRFMEMQSGNESFTLIIRDCI